MSEVNLLPSSARFVREDCRAQQRTGVGPQIADMRAGVLRALVKANTCDDARNIGRELHAELHRKSVWFCRVHRYRRWRPDTARTVRRRRGTDRRVDARIRGLEVAAVVGSS